MANDDAPPLISSGIDVHGTDAWVIITRDHPLSSMTMSYGTAMKLRDDLDQVIAERIARHHRESTD